jgi:hypothetical protein
MRPPVAFNACRRMEFQLALPSPAPHVIIYAMSTTRLTADGDDTVPQFAFAGASDPAAGGRHVRRHGGLQPPHGAGRGA